MQKNSQKFTFSIVFTNEKRVDNINPPAIKYNGKKHPIKSKDKLPFLKYSVILDQYNLIESFSYLIDFAD